MVKKLIFILSLLCTVSSLLAAPTTKMTLLLDWYINPDHAPILLAMSQGYFKKNNLEVTIIEPSSPDDAAKIVAIKKVDMAITYGPHYLQQLKQGLPIQQIGTLISSPLACLVYLPSSGIHSPEDLKRKRIGYSDASDEFTLLKNVLKSAGLTLNDVTLINVHYSLTQALMTHKIDVADDMMRNVEPVILEKYHFSPKMFYPENFGIAPYSELIYITQIGPAKPEITAFLRALQESTQYLKNHPDAAWESIIRAYPQLNTDTNYAIWKKTLPLFSLDPQLTIKTTS